jgi:hypothetical protein
MFLDFNNLAILVVLVQGLRHPRDGVKSCAMEGRIRAILGCLSQRDRDTGAWPIRTSRFNNRRWDLTRESKFETTLGDLVVALTEETARHVRDEKTAYEVVAYILANFVRGSNRQFEQSH